MVVPLWMRHTPIVIAVVVAGLSTGEARAAGPWPEPTAVATPDTVADSVSVGFGANGRGLLSWRFASDPLRPSLLYGSTGLLAVTAAGGLGARVDVSRPIVGEPVLFGRDRYVLLRRGARCPRLVYECSPDGTRSRVRLTVAFGRITGTLGRAREIDRFVAAGAAMIAGNDRGRLAVAYTERRSAADIVWLARRSPGRPFDRPVAVARARGVGHASVAVGERGEILVAYTRRGRLNARLARPGRGLGRAQDLGPAGELFALATAVTPTGRAVVAAQFQRLIGDRGIPDSAMTVRAATRGARTARFGPMRLLDRAHIVAGASAKILIAVHANGQATLAWNSALPDRRDAVRVRRIAPDGTILAAQNPGLADIGDLAARPDGSTIAVGQGALVSIPGTPQNARQIIATLGTPAGDFPPPELIALASGGANTSVAINPRTGRPTVAWWGPDETGVPSIRTATRS